MEENHALKFTCDGEARVLEPHAVEQGCQEFAPSMTPEVIVCAEVEEKPLSRVYGVNRVRARPT